MPYRKTALFLKKTAVFFLLISFAFPASAQESPLSLLTSPLPISLKAAPGSSVTTDLRIKNSGTAPETLQASLMKFEAYEDTGKPALMEREAGDDFLDWVTFSEPTFTIGPNEWKTIQATIQIPETASFGYYYAFVFSRAEEAAPQNPGETAIQGGTAILALLEVDVPNAKKEAILEEFSLDQGFYEFLPATFHLSVKNQGNVHLAPRGNIFISSGSKKDIALLEINEEKGFILPQSERTFEAAWNDGFPRYIPKLEDGKEVKDEEGNAVMELQWNWEDASKLRIGKYTAKMLLIYDDGSHDVPIEGVVSFWVIPWRLLLGAAVILLFFLVGLRSTLTNLYRKIFGRKQYEA